MATKLLPRLEPVSAGSCEPGTWGLARWGQQPALVLVQDQRQELNETVLVDFTSEGRGGVAPTRRIHQAPNQAHHFVRFCSSPQIEFMAYGGYSLLPEEQENIGKIVLTKGGPQLLIQDFNEPEFFMSFNLETNELNPGPPDKGPIVTSWRLRVIEDDGKAYFTHEIAR